MQTSAVSVRELRRRFEAADLAVLDKLFGRCGGLSCNEDPPLLEIDATGTDNDADQLRPRFPELLEVPSTQVIVTLVSPETMCGDTADFS